MADISCFEKNVPTVGGWIVKKFGTDVHVPVRVFLNLLSDPLKLG